MVYFMMPSMFLAVCSTWVKPVITIENSLMCFILPDREAVLDLLQFRFTFIQFFTGKELFFTRKEIFQSVIVEGLGKPCLEYGYSIILLCAAKQGFEVIIIRIIQ